MLPAHAATHAVCSSKPIMQTGPEMRMLPGARTVLMQQCSNVVCKLYSTVD